MPDAHQLSALEQAAAMKRGDLRPTELVEHYLARIERLSDSVGAFVTVTAELAIDAAKRAETSLLGSADPPPLFGVPVAIKDLNLAAGVRTKFGSAVMADFVAPISDNVVSRMAAAGLVGLGKTNTPEFGLACYTEPEVAPPARCPFEISRSAGGSSGGAGAAVASGLTPLAQGSDGAGSIRIPASVCGVVGLKTSRGRVSGGPVMADVSGLSVNGPIGRTVSDVAALLDVMAGPMPGDPYWAPPLAPGETFLAASRTPVGRLRIGISRQPVISDSEVDPLCIAAFEDACLLLEELGHEVVETGPPFGRELVPVFEMIWAAGASSIPVATEREGDLRPLTRWLRERGRAVSAPQLLGALASAQIAARGAVASSSGYDAVLTPTLAQPPAFVGALRDDEHPELDFEAQKRFTPFTAPANITGQPAISLPLYWTADDLPIGVQLIGRPAGEASLLALAAQLEQARPWDERHPSCW